MLAAAEKARQIKSRIWNPVNGNHSSELDVVAEPVLRRRRIEIATRDDVERRERETRERAAATVFDLLYDKAHREHAERECGYRSVESILKAVCVHFGITRIDLLSARKTADVVHSRHVAMYLAKTWTLRSLPEIGRRLGGRDHTTILHGVRKIQWMLDTAHPKVTADIAQLREILGVE